ncbi:MAG: hypothetical protein Q4E73_07410 [Lachnospiraceae bacterium]|nr:hypothetical protein [Lachnospiraceae bacterium]
MKEFMAEYGSVVVTVIIVLAVCAFVSAAFTPQLQEALTDTLETFFTKSGALHS